MAKKTTRPKPQTPQANSKTLVVLLWIVLPSLLIGLSALALDFWRVPTRVQLDLRAQSLEFTTASDRPGYPLLKSALKFTALEIDGFEQAEFSPKRLTVHGASVAPEYESAARAMNGFPHPSPLPQGEGDKVAAAFTVSVPGRSAPQPFKEQTFRLFGGQNPRARFALETPAQLAALEIAAGTTLRLAASAQQLQLKWPDSAQTLEILAGNPASPRTKGEAATPPLRLHAAHVRRQSPAAASEIDLQWDVELRSDAPLLKITTLAGGDLALTLPSAEPLEFLGGLALPVIRIGFQQQGDNGYAVSTLLGKGKIRYPDYPKLPERDIAAEALLSLTAADAASLSLTGLSLDGSGALAFSLSGRVERLWSGRDYRLTKLDGLWNDALAITLLVIMTWTCTVSVGIYKLYREIAKP